MAWRLDRTRRLTTDQLPNGDPSLPLHSSRFHGQQDSHNQRNCGTGIKNHDVRNLNHFGDKIAQLTAFDKKRQIPESVATDELLEAVTEANGLEGAGVYVLVVLKQVSLIRRVRVPRRGRL